ncbi:MAG: biopolymer transporter ExbD [Pseudomonadota bacterium]
MQTNLRKQHFSGSNYRPLTEINVTPFVDVMLVLLIVFMVIAPLLLIGVRTDLSKTDGAEAESVSTDLTELIVELDQNGVISIDAKQVDLAELPAELDRIAGLGQGRMIYVHADAALDYGSVVQVLVQIIAAGYQSPRLGIRVGQDS